MTARSASRGRRAVRFRRKAPTAHVADAPAVEVLDLSASLNGRLVLTDVTFRLDAGHQLGVVGPNGAGKTTLLRLIAGLLPGAGGEIRVHGHGPCGHICIAYVPQRSGIDWRFPVTVYDVAMMGRIGRIGPVRHPRAADHQVVRDALAAVELSNLADRQIEELSGGQQQRMFLARALAQEADLILLDEPFAGLDVPSRREILELLGALRKRMVSVVVALHDLGTAASSFDEVLLLNRRMIGHGDASAVFTETNLREAYGSCLHLVDGEAGPVVVHDTACAGGDDGVH